MRRFSLSMLLVAICLLPVGIGSGTSAHSHAVAALDGALANTAAAQAQVLQDYFSRARSIDLLTANNPAFRRFYRTSGERAARIRAGGPVLDRPTRPSATWRPCSPTASAKPASSTGPGPRSPAWSGASGPPRNAPPSWPNATRPWPGWPRRWGSGYGSSYPDGLAGDQIPLGADHRCLRRLPP